MQRLFVAYNKSASRTNHVEERLEQFRKRVQRDATDLALVAHSHDQSVNEHGREIRQLTESVEDMQARITGLDTLSQKMLQHEHHVNQTIDRNTHSQTASICAIIEEQKDLRKLVEEHVEELGNQIVKWNNRLPDLNDENDEKVPTAIEVQEELTALSDSSSGRFQRIFNRLHTLEGIVDTLEHSREQSWEAVSNRVSTLVEGSVTSLSG